MAMQDNNRVVWGYVADGTLGTFAVSAKAVYVLDATDGAKYGGSAPAASVPPKPKQLRMRAVKCICAGHPDIWVPVYAVTAALWTTPGTTVVRNVNGADETYEATRFHRGEHFPDGIRQTT